MSYQHNITPSVLSVLKDPWQKIIYHQQQSRIYWSEDRVRSLEHAMYARNLIEEQDTPSEVEDFVSMMGFY